MEDKPNYKIEKYKRKAASSALKDYCLFSDKDGFIEVTEWYNGEGYDISIYRRSKELNFGLTYGEAKAIKKLIKKLS